MDNVELSPATRWGMILTGLLQGLVCYLLIAWLAGKNHHSALFIACPDRSFIRFTLLRDLFFKQKALGDWLALVFIATLGMSGWLKWQLDT